MSPQDQADSLLLLRSLHTIVEPHHTPTVHAFTRQVERACDVVGLAPCIEAALGCLQALVSACPDMPQHDAYCAALEAVDEPSDASPHDTLALFEALELAADLECAGSLTAEA